MECIERIHLQVVFMAQIGQYLSVHRVIVEDGSAGLLEFFGDAQGFVAVEQLPQGIV